MSVENELGVQAPIVFPDKGELGDARLSPKEANVKQREIIRGMRRKDILPEQQYLTDPLKSLGAPMAWQELVRRLKLLAPDLIIMDGGVRGAIQLRVPNPRPEENEDATKYVGGFMKDVLSEYDTAELDQWGVANKFKRGWRTVVLNLIKHGYASKAKADKIFGEATGQRSILWERNLHDRELK